MEGPGALDCITLLADSVAHRIVRCGRCAAIRITPQEGEYSLFHSFQQAGHAMIPTSCLPF